MYHRIAEVKADPWQLAVAPNRFEEQLSVLRHLREPLTMTEFVNGLERGELPANAVAVTFDDGYVDNLQNAKPRLAQAGIPATVFIATGSVGSAREFWWDELARLILHSGEINFELLIAGDLLRLALPTEPLPVSPWNDWQRPRTERESAYLAIWERLQSLSSSERENAMTSLRAAIESQGPSSDDLPMTACEVRELASDGLIQVGAHSITHPLLTKLPPVERWREIAISKRECEQLVHGRIEAFAYPHGAFDNDTCAMVREAGFRLACATRGKAVNIRQFDSLTLPRLQVMNWTGEAFECALREAS